MAMALRLNWLDRRGRSKHRAAYARAPIVASRDLPPLDALTHLPLPRSPEPLPDEALVFALAAQKAADPAPEPEYPEAESAAAKADGFTIATGADLRGMLDRFRKASKRREARDQAAQARARLVERLSAGRAGQSGVPPLRLVGSDVAPLLDDDADLDRALEEALASALGTLRRLSELTRR